MSCTATRRPLFCLSAFLSAFIAEALGLTVKVTWPGAETALLPFAKTIRDGRHLPPSLIKPLRHFVVLAAKTPNFPFWKVNSQLKVPGSPTASVNVIAPVLGFIAATSELKAPAGAITRRGRGAGGVVNTSSEPTLWPPLLDATTLRW